MKTTERQYARALYDLTKGKNQEEIDDMVLKFAEELRRSREMKMLGGIIEKFEEIYNQENEIVVVQLVSASELENDQIEKITNFLKEKYSAKEIVLNQKVDKDVIGGLIVKVGDDVIDGSIRGKVQRLRQDLSK